MLHKVTSEALVQLTDQSRNPLLSANQSTARQLARRFITPVCVFGAWLLMAMNGYALTCTAASGNQNWSNTATWSCGQVPTSADDVIIPNGSTVTLNANTANASSLLVNGTFYINGQNNNNRALTVAGEVTIASGAAISIDTPTGGIADVHTLTIGGNFTNNGTFSRLLVNDVINVVMNGTALQTISGSTPTIFNDLTINNGAGVSLAQNITVAATLTLLTDLNIGTFTVTHTGGPLACGAGPGDAIGALVRNTTFAIGQAYCFGNINNQITFTNGAAPTGSLTLHLVKNAPSDFIAAVRRAYTITPGGGFSFTTPYRLRLRYFDSPTELNANLEADLVLWNDSGTGWSPVGGAATISDNYVEANVALAFSRWTLARPSAPTAIRMKSADALPFAGGVRLHWSTGYEMNNLGFRVYREENGERMPVTPGIVAGSALLVGARAELTAGFSYAWHDPKGSGQSIYWIEDVDLNGTSAWHGPIIARKAETAASEDDTPILKPRRNTRMLLQLGNELSRAVQSETDPTHDLTPVAELNDYALANQTAARGNRGGGDGLMPVRARMLGGERAIQISVKQEGWYRLTQPALVAAGLDANSDPRGFKLFVSGREIACNVTGAEDGRFDATDVIEFYGLGLDTAATDTRVYWLLAERTPGARIRKLPLANTTAAGASFRHTVERRERLIYFSSLVNGEAENFFGAVVTPNEPLAQTLRVHGVDRTATEPVTLEVALQGVTAQPHATRVSFNGHQLGLVNFQHREPGVLRFTIPANQLVEGHNTVTLQGTDGAEDFSLVTHLRLTYNRLFQADNDALAVTVGAFRQTTITGFTSQEVRVFDVTNDTHVTELTTQVTKTGTTFSVTATPQGTGPRRLLALTDARAATVAGIKANTPSKWMRATNAADLLIVTHDTLAAEFAPLAELRRAQGLRVAIVDIEDVYDELNDGNKSLNALSNFLVFAARVWAGPPRYVLLAGDASYDPRNYTGKGYHDLVPARLVEASTMEAVSDDALADFDGNTLADLSIGRLPARTAAEARRMVERLLNYDKAAPSNETVLVSDINEDFDFEAVNEQLRVLVPSNQQATHIARAKRGDAAARTAVLAALNRGARVVNYVGHGSLDVWGANSGNLFTSADALALRNGNQPSVYVLMTCLNGYFIDAGNDSLAEALLKSPNGGAIAVWAGAALTPASGQALMNRAAFPALFTAGRMLGDVTREAKAATPNADIRRTWILFGDPSMRLR